MQMSSKKILAKYKKSNIFDKEPKNLDFKFKFEAVLEEK